MKEATGELNMTVITVVAIAAIAGIFYAFVWPAIRQNIERSTYCANAACDPDGKNCTYVDKDGNTAGPIDCSSYQKQNNNK